MAKFSEYRDQKIPEDEVGSHAECLAAMDCLMHHMNDEDEIACWLQDGVPDSDNWRPFGRFSRLRSVGSAGSRTPRTRPSTARTTTRTSRGA